MHAGDEEHLRRSRRFHSRWVVRDPVAELREPQVWARDGADLFALLRGQIEHRPGVAQYLPGPDRVQRWGKRMAGRHHHAMGLQHVGDAPSSCGQRHRQHDKFAGEMDVHDVKTRPDAVEPPDKSGCAHAGETGSRNQCSSGKQADRHPVQLSGRDPITSGGGRDRHIVAPCDQFRALIQRHACWAPIGPVGTEECHHLEDAHQLSAMVARGGRTIESGGTSLVTSDVAPTTEFAPMVTPRSTVLRAHNHAPFSMTIGPLSNSKVGDRRSWLPVQRYTC